MINCQECNNNQATSMLTNLAGNMKLVCDKCANEIREKQFAAMLYGVDMKKREKSLTCRTCAHLTKYIHQEYSCRLLGRLVTINQDACTAYIVQKGEKSC